MKHWMVKSEPTSYGWDQFVKDGRTSWTGVRNFQARNNLRAMREGDPVFFYHSVVGKEVVGIAKVAREAYPDPTAKEGDWSCVDLVPGKPLKHSVSLDAIKKVKSLQDMALLRNSRLSVMPLTPDEYKTVLEMGK